MSDVMQLSLLDGGCEATAPRRPELTLVPWPTGWRKLPVRTQSQLVSRRRGVCVTAPGYHKGRKPGNWGKTYPAEILSPSEMLQLLAATGGGYAGCRDRALYVTLYRTGLRIAEALALMPKDVDLEQGRATVLHGKNDKRRVVGLDQPAIDAIETWLPKRAELGVGRQNPVFCVIAKPTIGQHLYASCVREQLRDCARRAGIEKRVHPHGLRHSFASELASEGVPINVISRLLGHSNSATTARYIDHLNPEQAIEVARARTWAVAA